MCQCGEGNEVGKTLYSLSGLKISDGNNNSESNNILPDYPQMKKEPCRYRPESAGPIEILPHLYLGNKKDSADRKCLENHHIRYVLNVTHDLPNEFEHEQDFSYMQLPVQDNWDGNLFSLFPQAFAFIGKTIQYFLFCASRGKSFLKIVWMMWYDSEITQFLCDFRDFLCDLPFLFFNLF